MQNNTSTERVRHPIRDVMRREGLTYRWMQRRVRKSASYLARVFNGFEPAIPSLRADCAAALDLPESELFADDRAPAEVA